MNEMKEMKGTTLQEMINKLSPADRAEVETLTAELIAEEMSLRDLRKALKKTQVHLARKLKIKQENVSRIEKRTDLLLSTLTGYVEAMGGKLRLVAEFPGRPPVALTGIAVLDNRPTPSPPPVSKRLHHKAGAPRTRTAETQD